MASVFQELHMKHYNNILNVDGKAQFGKIPKVTVKRIYLNLMTRKQIPRSKLLNK